MKFPDILINLFFCRYIMMRFDIVYSKYGNRATHELKQSPFVCKKINEIFRNLR